mmetsp:Transcript_36450/g.77697  ORF Transcript_36450/g.77697 Transcript_36450/m.77697 type:complete len:87 (+) Transcript_36450:225-485(+)
MISSSQTIRSSNKVLIQIFDICFLTCFCTYQTRLGSKMPSHNNQRRIDYQFETIRETEITAELLPIFGAFYLANRRHNEKVAYYSL